MNRADDTKNTLSSEEKEKLNEIFGIQPKEAHIQSYVPWEWLVHGLLNCSGPNTRLHDISLDVELVVQILSISEQQKPLFLAWVILTADREYLEDVASFFLSEVNLIYCLTSLAAVEYVNSAIKFGIDWTKNPKFLEQLFIGMFQFQKNREAGAARKLMIYCLRTLEQIFNETVHYTIRQSIRESLLSNFENAALISALLQHDLLSFKEVKDFTEQAIKKFNYSNPDLKEALTLLSLIESISSHKEASKEELVSFAEIANTIYSQINNKAKIEEKVIAYIEDVLKSIQSQLDKKNPKKKRAETTDSAPFKKEEHPPKAAAPPKKDLTRQGKLKRENLNTGPVNLPLTDGTSHKHGMYKSNPNPNPNPEKEGNAQIIPGPQRPSAQEVEEYENQIKKKNKEKQRPRENVQPIPSRENFQRTSRENVQRIPSKEEINFYEMNQIKAKKVISKLEDKRKELKQKILVLEKNTENSGIVSEIMSGVKDFFLLRETKRDLEVQLIELEDAIRSVNSHEFQIINYYYEKFFK